MPSVTVCSRGYSSRRNRSACSSRKSSPRERLSAPSPRSAMIDALSLGSSSQMIRQCRPHAASSASFIDDGDSSWSAS